MKQFKTNKSKTIITLIDENKKFIVESAITPGTNYSTLEFIRHPELGRAFLMVTAADKKPMFELSA